MNTGTKKTAPATADVYICPCNAGFILSVGPVCLWLERATAENVLSTLREALSVDLRAVATDGDGPDDGSGSN
jgi:hypothetical protein